MQQIKVDVALAEKLAKLKGEAVLVDEQERVLGYFSPVECSTKLEELLLECPTSIEESEELRKRARINHGRPLKEILNELGY